MSLHPYSTKKQAACESLAVAGPPPHPTSSSPHPPTPSSPHPPTATPQPSPHMAVAPATRRASDRQRPCHPPLALAPRRLYTSPMHNPTSACPRLPDAARGTSPRSTNCPDNGPPYPQNGSCWTRRIVSAVDRFEADSFPKKEQLGGGTNRRSSPRPQGLSPRRETFAQPPFPHLHPGFPRKRESRVDVAWRGSLPYALRRATPQPSPHVAVAPATRRAATRVKPRRRCQGGSPAKEQSTRKTMPKLPGVSTKQTINPLCTLQVQKAQKKGQTIHRTITIKQPAAGGDPLRRRRTGATPSLCGALQCPKPHPRDTARSLEHYGDPCTTVIPAPPPRWIPAHPRLGDPATLPLQGRRASDPPWRPHNPPPTKPSRSDRQRPGV